jgi:CHAD domain-containing protein
LIVVERARPRHREALRRGLAGAGARIVPEGWYAQLAHSAGLRGGYSPRPRVNVATDASLRALAAGVFLHLIDVIEANEAGVRDDVDPEFLHDFRVAVRRTRTALSQMKGVLSAESTRGFRARFADVARVCGPLRDLDVQLMQRDDYRTLVTSGLRSDLDDVFARLAQERAREQNVVAGVIGGASYRRLKRDWRATIRALRSGPPLGLDAEEPAIRVGKGVILHRYERIGESLAAAAAGDDAMLPRVRVECKKLRYALEFFAPMIDGAEDALAQLERVQDALGEYNDLVVQEVRLGALLQSESPGAPGVVGRSAAIGAALAGLERRRVRARERCADRLAELAGRRFSRSVTRITDEHGPDRRSEC